MRCVWKYHIAIHFRGNPWCILVQHGLMVLFHKVSVLWDNLIKIATLGLGHQGISCPMLSQPASSKTELSAASSLVVTGGKWGMSPGEAGGDGEPEG